jgi:hypothetical protein
MSRLGAGRGRLASGGVLSTRSLPCAARAARPSRPLVACSWMPKATLTVAGNSLPPSGAAEAAAVRGSAAPHPNAAAVDTGEPVTVLTGSDEREERAVDISLRVVKALADDEFGRDWSCDGADAEGFLAAVPEDVP